MQPERQISIAFTGIAAALIIPEYVAVSRHQPVTLGVGVVVGAVLGALGVFGGSLMAVEHSSRSARVLGLAVWILISLGFSGAAFVGAAHGAGWWPRTVFGLAGLLPLLGPIVVLARRDQA